MLARLVEASVRFRAALLLVLALLVGAGLVAARTLPIDAMPDVSTVQVSVLTTAAGLSPVEVERSVTMPVESALNGVPGGVELRSVSRAGLSSVTVVFRDGSDVWFARQLVLERLRGVELPPSASTPELAPVSSGLGEIFQFVVRSDQHDAMQLRTILDWEIVPRLRRVPGVVEVNTMGGQLKQYQVVLDRSRLASHGLTARQVIDAVRASHTSVGGGYLERGPESFVLRGQGLLRDEREIEDVVVVAHEGATPVLVRHVGEVRIDAALRYGVITRDGVGEAVTGVVMMLLGENSREVVSAVGREVKALGGSLPPGVQIDVVYDRAEFVGRTISTVLTNLVEGVLVVLVVLALFLGTLRGALAVVLGIPASMSIALFGMHLFGVTGDLMSLGAIDFGFLVDGPIVLLEAAVAATAGAKLSEHERVRAFTEAAARVARPVVFAVAIIMLVYVPLLALEGIEGKMFRPMAMTMAFALFGALVYSIVFFPAVLVALVPAGGHGPAWLGVVERWYGRWVGAFVRFRVPIFAGALGALGVVGVFFARAGAEFVPRIFEGDAVVTIRRSPSVGLTEARRLDLEVERVLLEFPEVRTALGMTGRAEVATDPVGNDNTDVLVRLAPLAEWTTARDFDALSEAIKERVESRVPGTFVSVSQPIEDRTNELISGSRADVSVRITGNELEELAQLASRVGEVVSSIQGTGDVRVERILGQPTLTAVADRAAMARLGVRADDAFLALAAAREGVDVGDVYDGTRRFDLRILAPPAAPTREAIGDLLVERPGGRPVPLREVVRIEEGDGPSGVRRQDRERTVRVDVNLRGRDLVSWVDDAKAQVAKAVPLGPGVRVEWGGQFENFERAQERLAVVVPLAVALILGMLVWMFGELRLALAVFVMVPLSLTGGMLGLLARGMSFSLPAAVGFIALGGVAVLNGVVVASEVRRRVQEGEPLEEAVKEGPVHAVRAVLTTAAVAALGFLPMALSTGAGAEVQRPLATVVVAGMASGTLLALAVLPGVLGVALRGRGAGHSGPPAPTASKRDPREPEPAVSYEPAGAEPPEGIAATEE